LAWAAIAHKVSTLPVEPAILELTNISVAIAQKVSTLPIEPVILEFTNIFITIGCGVSSKTIVEISRRWASRQLTLSVSTPPSKQAKQDQAVYGSHSHQS
jgi:hypothetical protein